MEESTRTTGDESEDIAVDYLQNNGYEIIERNYRFGKIGEIDIVAKDPQDGCTVFVEVKSRKTTYYGTPEEAITKNKQKQMRKMGKLYIYDKGYDELLCRFDVVTVLTGDDNNPIINHYKNVIHLY
ncbi:MAG: YraN family protein [Ignavibacteriaceae bacterium]|nr:YraN family protein [Ignavibacteriaceae bacterium]